VTGTAVSLVPHILFLSICYQLVKHRFTFPINCLLVVRDFNGKIVRGLRASQPDVDMIRVQDTDLSGRDDPTVLEWAAKEG
jgi:hypothetical protein